MSDMFGGNGGSDKSHLLAGMLMGNLSAAKGDIKDLEQALKNTRESLNNVGSEAITAFAECNAWKELALTLVDEIKNPENPRRFSAPDADSERARLLQNVHRQSYEASVNKGIMNGVYNIIPNAYAKAKTESILKVRGYLAELIEEDSKRRNGVKSRFKF